MQKSLLSPHRQNSCFWAKIGNHRSAVTVPFSINGQILVPVQHLLEELGDTSQEVDAPPGTHLHNPATAEPIKH